MLTSLKINNKFYGKAETITENIFANVRIAQITNKQRISIERIALMQAAWDYYNRKIKDLDMISYYFEAYKYFFVDGEHKKEIGCLYYGFGSTLEETIYENINFLQLYQESDPRGCVRRLNSER